MTYREMGVTVGLLCSLIFASCGRNEPANKPIGTATNKHAEQAPSSAGRSEADAMAQQMPPAMVDPGRMEAFSNRSAGQTRRLPDHTNP